MCLFYDEEATKKFWNTKARKGKTWCWAYKVYRLIGGKLFPAFGTLFINGDRPVKPGFIISDRQVITPFKDPYEIKPSGNVFDNEIHRGIHTIVNSQAVPLMFSNWTPDKLVTVRVQCYKKDFVAASDSQPAKNPDPNGFGKWRGGRGEAVFMKVFLPKSEYDRVTKKGK